MSNTPSLRAEASMTNNAKALRGNTGNYVRWNLDVLGIENGKSMLDLGCGPGMYFDAIMEHLPSFYFGTDYSANFLDEMKNLVADREDCALSNINLLDENAFLVFKGHSFDYVMLFDVLEHIDNDVAALSNIARIVSATGKGRLLVRVPALQAIYGENDRAIGHFRRYSKKSLGNLLESSGFEILKIGYQNIAGILPWFIIGRGMKRDLAVSSGEGKLFDMLVPVFRVAERILPPPIGLSVYAICVLNEDGPESAG